MSVNENQEIQAEDKATQLDDRSLEQVSGGQQGADMDVSETRGHNRENSRNPTEKGHTA